MPVSDVACPSRRQSLPEEGAGPEAGETAAAVGARVWPELRQSRTFLI